MIFHLERLSLCQHFSFRQISCHLKFSSDQHSFALYFSSDQCRLSFPTSILVKSVSYFQASDVVLIRSALATFLYFHHSLLPQLSCSYFDFDSSSFYFRFFRRALFFLSLLFIFIYYFIIDVNSALFIIPI